MTIEREALPWPTKCRLGYLGYENECYCSEHGDFTSCANPHGNCAEAERQWRQWRENMRVLKHEAETHMRGHDDGGGCCLRARLGVEAAR